MWFIGVGIEQETTAPPPKKNPGSAPETSLCQNLSAPASSIFLERHSKVGKGEGTDNIGFTLTSDSII